MQFDNRIVARRAPLFLMVLLGVLPGITQGPRDAARAADRSAIAVLAASNARTPQASAPPPIEYFNAYEVWAGVELCWAAFMESDVKGFRIYRRENGLPHYMLVNNDGLIRAWETEYMDGEPRAGATYQYVLGVVRPDGAEYISQPVEVTRSKGARR